MFSEAPVVLRVPCFAPELYVRADIERKPAEKKKDTYHNIRQARVRFGAHVRARCRARCRCRSPVPRAPIRTQTQVFTYVRTFVSACERTCV